MHDREKSYAPDQKRMNIVMAGGGTGGHLFPAIAIAKAFIKRNRENRILFVSSGRDFEKNALKREGFSHITIPIEGIKGRGRVTQVIAAAKIPAAILKSMQILRHFKPDMVIGVGGYSAGPVVAAAKLMQIKTAVCEQNIFPGVTNRILFKIADRIYSGFENTEGTKGLKKVMAFGNPVREEIATAAKNGHVHRTTTGKKRFTILIIGGSQGAHAINMAMIEALDRLDLKNGIQVIHQTGLDDEKMVADAYREKNISGEVKAFFHDMISLYLKADLVICRAGATTVAEIAAIGKAAIYIPFPHAADNHQVLNAAGMVKSGAAEMIQQKDLSGKVLAKRIIHYMEKPDLIRRMGANAGKLGKPDAAERIVDDCCIQLGQQRLREKYVS